MSTKIYISGKSSPLSQEEILDGKVISYCRSLNKKTWYLELSLVLTSDL